MEKRFLESILDKIEVEYPSQIAKRWTRNSRWSDVLLQMDDNKINDFAGKIISYIEECQENYKPKSLPADSERLKDKKYISRRSYITLTFNKNNKDLLIDSNEVFIERFFSFLSNINQPTFSICWNQYQVGKYYKEAIDIRMKYNEKYNLVELKALNTKGSADNPLFAIIESVKNYYLYPQHDNINKLIVLATKDYWNKYVYNEDIYIKILKIIREIHKNNPSININLMYINCTKNDLNNFLTIFKTKVNEKDFAQETTSKIHDRCQYTNFCNYKLEIIYEWLKKDFKLNELFKIDNYIFEGN
ncbi:MAG: hypothetical protein IJ681_00755 [Bacteroidales bacterium]|nr:hypothetical protein [Bacteroidales bacterium]